MTDNRMTPAELKQLFPRGIPAPVMKLLFPERFCGDLDHNDFRAVIRACARGQDVLVGYTLFPVFVTESDAIAHALGDPCLAGLVEEPPPFKAPPKATYKEGHGYGSREFADAYSAAQRTIDRAGAYQDGDKAEISSALRGAELVAQLIGKLVDNNALTPAQAAEIVGMTLVEE
jgi:hypothetical protein